MEEEILLVTPPCNKEWRNLSPPLGIAQIAAVLEEGGFKTKCVDGNPLKDEDFAELLSKFKNVKLVGVSCPTTEQRIESTKLVNLIKEINPKMNVVLGGCHFSVYPKHAFISSKVDVVCIGEGEYTILELANYFIKKINNLEDIKGIAFMKGDEMILTPKREFIENLDDLPFPKYDDFKLPDYFKNISYRDLIPWTKELIPGKLATSRGCPFNCSFCSVPSFWGHKVRYRSTDKVADEIKHMQKKYGVEWLFVSDDNSTFDKKRTIELCKKIVNDKIKIAWVVCSRTSIDLETMQWMKKAGCVGIMFGVESGDDEVLKKMGKSHTTEDIVNAFKRTREAGILPMGFLMVGNRGDSFKSMWNTFKLWKKIQPIDKGIGAAITWVFPGTGLYKDCVEKGLLKDDDWLKDMPVPFYTAENSLRKLKMMRTYLYALWFGHVILNGNLKLKLSYARKAFDFTWGNVKYFVVEKQSKTY